MRRPTQLLVVLLALSALGQAARAESDRIESIDIEGRLVDDKQKLIHFLGLSPGLLCSGSGRSSRWPTILAKQLGYRLVSYTAAEGQKGIKLRLTIEPMRVVRNVRVHGNWPLFDDEINPDTCSSARARACRPTTSSRPFCAQRPTRSKSSSSATATSTAR